MATTPDHPEPAPVPEAAAPAPDSPAPADPPPAPAPEASASAAKPKAKVSPARNAIMATVLVVLLVVFGLEITAVMGVKNAAARLDKALEASQDDLITIEEAESKLIGRQADGPGEEIPVNGHLVKTYTWRGAIRRHTLSAEYATGTFPGLIKYEIGGAEAAAAE